MITYSANGMTISEALQVNAIAWIHSLPDGEMGPTRRILEDLESLAAVGNGFTVYSQPVRNCAELTNALAGLTIQAQQGHRPIVHIDAHGSVADGLLLAPSGERMKWSEIIEALRGLNVATQNNLVSIFALCHGLNLYKQVSLKMSVPAYLFCGPQSEISVGFLEEQTLEFYREVNRTSNVTAAFQKTLGIGGQMESFHCQGLFFQALLRYIRTYCTGKSRQSRQEDLVTGVLKKNGITRPTSRQLQETRRQVREVLTPGQHLIDRFAPRFLVGRAAAFTYADIDRVLKHNATNKK